MREPGAQPWRQVVSHALYQDKLRARDRGSSCSSAARVAHLIGKAVYDESWHHGSGSLTRPTLEVRRGCQAAGRQYRFRFARHALQLRTRLAQGSW